ncbi:hypothetical protein AB0I53_48630 [Saccharopolyspora sp. NPDC050389]|uniref:hypothetical protein n=1 Tax=Saccharopolyspora sp. NPDC050389 TaxID=3155516 RepID=UPI0033E2A3D0
MSDESRKRGLEDQAVLIRATAGLEPVPAASNGVPCTACDGEDGTGDDRDDAENPDDLDPSEESDDEKDDTEGNHGRAFLPKSGSDALKCLPWIHRRAGARRCVVNGKVPFELG